MAPRPPLESSGELDVIKERLRIYEAAVVVAKEKGEESKARRYQRAINNINTVAKQVWSDHVISVKFHSVVTARLVLDKQL